MIVLDASAAVEWLLNLPHAAGVDRRVQAGDSVHAPCLLDVEVAQVVRRHAARGELDVRRGAAAITALADMAVTRYAHAALLPRIWDLRANLTAYDAAYVALAEALRAPLVTLDARLARAPGHSATVDLVT